MRKLKVINIQHCDILFRLFFFAGLIFFTGNLVTAQTISGNFSLLPNKPIRLEGFNGLKTYPIANTNTDAVGSFKLNYTKGDYGVETDVTEDKIKQIETDQFCLHRHDKPLDAISNFSSDELKKLSARFGVDQTIKYKKAELYQETTIRCIW
jgi:hypothetical protein